MNNEFDINEVTAGVIESQVEGFVEIARSSAKNWSDKIRLALEASFKTYVKKIAERHSRARSFFHRAEPEFLYNFYVPIGIKTKARTISRADCNPLFGPTPHVVVQGSGGCGKSVLTRHILLDILRVKQRIPILVELRSLNQESRPLVSLIAESLSECGLALSPDVVQRGIKAGKFAILFDGFDELNDELRSRTAKDIRLLAQSGRQSWILVTSRPDELFSAWSEFTLFQAMPLTLDQAVELVNKTPVEDSLRERFITDLRASLFNRHKSFLSNPLLLSIMLLTYQDAADIPKKLSVFYSQAFEALFQRHDAWKGGYKRQRMCDIDIHDFARLFSAFSLVAYDRRMFSFSVSDALALVKRAIELTSLPVDPESFISDCTQAVCLLIQDGLQLAYSHRSFQEYFAARFIAEAPPTIKTKLLERCGQNIGQDSVITLLHEMQPEFVQDQFILPELKNLIGKIGIRSAHVSRAAHLRFLKLQFDEIRVSKKTGISAVYKEGARLGYVPLLRLAVEGCSHLTKRKLSKVTLESGSTFRSGLCGTEDEVVLPVSKLSQTHPVVRHLYESGGAFGSERLSIGWDVACAIETKTREHSRPIEEILRTSP